MSRNWIRFLVAQAVLRLAWRVTVGLLLLAVAVAAAPVTAVAAGAYAGAWIRGWAPRRLAVAAAWCGPMVLVWLVLAGRGGGWHAAASAPYQAWFEFWRLAGTGVAGLPRAAAGIAPAAIPLGLAAGAGAWSYRIRSLRAGAGGFSPAAAVAFDRRLWRRQASSARALISAPGSVPLITRKNVVVVGAVIRSVGHRTGRLAGLGYQRMRSHQVVVGTTGTGKTTLLLRLWAGFMTGGLRRHTAGLGPPPLLVVLDCKGGADARRIADRARRVLRDAGAKSTAIWPDETSLSLWSLPPRQLTTTLVDLIEHGSGGAAYYTDVMEALIALAVEAPCGPPLSAADLLDRLEPGWLSMAYAASGSSADHAMIRGAAGLIGDVALRYRTLFRRLGIGLDGPGGFADADAWYCILEGTDQIAVAEAQARALVDLLASFAVRSGNQREILLAVDEFSAVSRRLPIWQLYERARSLGLAVQVSAQSWQGLGGTPDERLRIAASAEGGIWLLRTPHPEPVTALAGTRKVTETTRQLRRFPVWSHRGTSRLREEPVVDPALIRDLDVGQAAYLYRGGVTYVQVKRLVAAPAVVAPAAPGPSRTAKAGPGRAGATGTSSDGVSPEDARRPAAGEAAGEAAGQMAQPRPVAAPLADVSAVLDAAFGDGAG